VAVPKRKKSRSTTRHRKAQWLRIPTPPQAKCAHCSSPIRPHTVCEVCGYYAGREVVKVED
jgi:large subunit ribosomal protein L32